MIDDGLIDGFTRVNYAGGYGFKALDWVFTRVAIKLRLWWKDPVVGANMRRWYGDDYMERLTKAEELVKQQRQKCHELLNNRKERKDK